MTALRTDHLGDNQKFIPELSGKLRRLGKLSRLFHSALPFFRNAASRLILIGNTIYHSTDDVCITIGHANISPPLTYFRSAARQSDILFKHRRYYRRTDTSKHRQAEQKRKCSWHATGSQERHQAPKKAPTKGAKNLQAPPRMPPVVRQKHIPFYKKCRFPTCKKTVLKQHFSKS